MIPLDFSNFFYHLSCLGKILSSKRMIHRLALKTIFCEPSACPAMQFRYQITLFPAQSLLEQIGKEMVVAIPAAFVVKRYNKEVGLFQGVQHLLAVFLLVQPLNHPLDDYAGYSLLTMFWVWTVSGQLPFVTKGWRRVSDGLTAAHDRGPEQAGAS